MKFSEAIYNTVPIDTLFVQFLSTSACHREVLAFATFCNTYVLILRYLNHLKGEKKEQPSHSLFLNIIPLLQKKRQQEKICSILLTRLQQKIPTNQTIADKKCAKRDDNKKRWLTSSFSYIQCFFILS